MNNQPVYANSLIKNFNAKKMKEKKKQTTKKNLIHSFIKMMNLLFTCIPEQNN